MLCQTNEVIPCTYYYYYNKLILGAFVVDESELNYLMLDHVKVLIGGAHLVEDVHSILKTNVMNVAIEDIMLVTVDVLKEGDAGKFFFSKLFYIWLHLFNFFEVKSSTVCEHLDKLFNVDYCHNHLNNGIVKMTIIGHFCRMFGWERLFS